VAFRSSDAYLRYLRTCGGEAMRIAHAVAGAESDDLEADFLDVDEHDFDDTDLE
jgi:hypothetical protein